MIGIHERVRRYLARMERAISGSGGRPATWSAALAAVRGFDLTEDAALSVLESWNASCCPPWSEKELRQLIRDAAKNSTKPAGYLLATSDRRQPVDEAAEKRGKRQTWPSMRPVSIAEMRMIASLRHVSVEAEGYWVDWWTSKGENDGEQRARGICARTPALPGKLSVPAMANTGMQSQTLPTTCCKERRAGMHLHQQQYNR